MLLTPEQLGVAIRANAYWRARFADWPDLLDALSATDRSSDADLADAVADFQKRHLPLTVDGVIGPKTAAAIRQETWRAPEGTDAFRVDGRRIAVDGVRVIDWTEEGGLSFYSAPKVSYSTRSKAPNLSVLHWSVTATAHQAFNVLIARGLSVQLVLDDDGTFYQCGDLVTMQAWHAGVVNGRSFGIEIAGGLPPRAGDPGVPLDVRGDQTRFGSFAKAQIGALAKAWPVLHRAIGIPLLLPRALPTEPSRTDGVTRLTDYRVAKGEFMGACGHYHVTTKKADPSAQLWMPLREAGFGAA